MIYVFEKIANMGECCGCHIAGRDLSLSVQNDLTSNWGLLGAFPNAGAIDIVSANPNVMEDAIPAEDIPGSST